MKQPKAKPTELLRAEAMTQARQHNNIREERIRGMKLEMEEPEVMKKYIRFFVYSHFKKTFVSTTPWMLRWVRWIQYALSVYNRRKAFKKELMG